MEKPPEPQGSSVGSLLAALSELELDFLRAASDLSRYQAELSELLSLELGMSPHAYWIGACVDGEPLAATLKPEYRSYRQRPRVGDWEPFFHGFECDMENVADGRFVRMDFGPRSRPLALSGFGVLQYVMCAREPWRSFPVLREWLAESGPPYGPLSGSHDKMSGIWSRLVDMSLFDPADAVLWSRRHEFEVFDAEIGRTVVRIPEDGTGPTASDLSLCGRAVLSLYATRVLPEADRSGPEALGRTY